MEYFCFVECKPMNTTIGSQCMPMTGPEIKKAKTDDGTAEDIWATPQSLMPPTVPPQPAPMPDLPEAPDDILVVKEPEAPKEEKPAPEPEKKDEAGAAKD